MDIQRLKIIRYIIEHETPFNDYPKYRGRVDACLDCLFLHVGQISLVKKRIAASAILVQKDATLLSYYKSKIFTMDRIIELENLLTNKKIVTSTDEAYLIRMIVRITPINYFEYF